MNADAKPDSGSKNDAPTSRKRAMEAKCRECIYDPLAGGNWRQQTGACRITDCPLWPFRPRSKPRSRSGGSNR